MRLTWVACMQEGAVHASAAAGQGAGMQVCGVLTSAMLADFLAGSTRKSAFAGSNIQPSAFSASTAPGTWKKTCTRCRFRVAFCVVDLCTRLHRCKLETTASAG